MNETRYEGKTKNNKQIKTIHSENCARSIDLNKNKNDNMSQDESK